VSLKRKLVATGAALVLAGGAAGAGLAAGGRSGSTPAVRQVQLRSTTEAGFVRAAAEYLGIDVEKLRGELRNRTLADVANTTPGRSAQALATVLTTAAVTKTVVAADHALTPRQDRLLHAVLRRRITGFMHDTCRLDLAGMAKHLGGCPGMSAASA
jgi:hypothetical protein